MIINETKFICDVCGQEINKEEVTGLVMYQPILSKYHPIELILAEDKKVQLEHFCPRCWKTVDALFPTMYKAWHKE